jgi:hypothetical protein
MQIALEQVEEQCTGIGTKASSSSDCHIREARVISIHQVERVTLLLFLQLLVPYNGVDRGDLDLEGSLDRPDHCQRRSCHA